MAFFSDFFKGNAQKNLGVRGGEVKSSTIWTYVTTVHIVARGRRGPLTPRFFCALPSPA
eukprot:NODE_7564_length_259_cov_9.971429_g6950_i0.p2 GENE.NODE_7564_length_259_cov_9.971429_g6950_i0~~NODE_7564_length_259_cov_9.971429_g6950_i0.p2  ORF type:complete len:59 (-),score=0.58 NODE_7564_length_259_cov_9.971429_g6950_i0:50-226(-)